MSINLDPIKDDLDNYNAHLDDINSFTDSDLKTIIERANRFGQIVNKGMRLIEFPEDALMDPLDLLYYACDHYIKQGNQDILDPSRYEEDSIVDGLSLYRLASVRFDERNTTSSLIDTVETYYTCMLTMNIIMCVNTCVMNYRSEAYKEQDYVWNRLRLEREIFNKVIQRKAAKEWNYLAVEKSVFAVARRLVKRYERLYAVFCDTVYALDHPDENTPDYFYGTEEYKKMYQEIQALLKISY